MVNHFKHYPRHAFSWKSLEPTPPSWLIFDDRRRMRHLPFIVCIVLGVVAVFAGYVIRFPVYFAWLVGVCGSLCTFVSMFAWLLLRAPGERKGALFLGAGVLTAVGYLPLHSALSEELKSADFHVRVNGHMEFALFAIPTLIAGLSIFHGVRLLAEKKRPIQASETTRGK